MGHLHIGADAQEPEPANGAPLIAEAMQLEVESALIDGEAVVTLPDGQTSFQTLQAIL
jgi:ATP-dependent DNA ligase